MPTSLDQSDTDGNHEGSIGFDSTINEQGYPTPDTSGSQFIEIDYTCQ